MLLTGISDEMPEGKAQKPHHKFFLLYKEGVGHMRPELTQARTHCREIKYDSHTCIATIHLF